MIKDVALKITLSFGFILTFLAIILLSKAPASDYELSIYDAIPIHVWFILLLCVVLGIISNINIIFLNANSFYWFISLLLILLNTQIVMLMPLIRNYAFYGRGDALSILGQIKDIQSHYFISSDNIYPVIHLLIVELSLLGDVNVSKMMQFLPAFFSLLYVVFMYCLSKTIFTSGEKAELATTFSTVLFLTSFSTAMPHVMVIIQGLGCFILPLFYYIYFKYLKFGIYNYSILLIILLILFPFFHPLIAIVVIIQLISIGFSPIFIGYSIMNNNNFIFLQRKLPINLIIITFTILLSWFLINARFWDNNILRAYMWFKGAIIGRDYLQEHLSLMDKANSYGYNLIDYFLRIYLSDLIFLFISIIGVIYVIRLAAKRNNTLENKNLYLLSIIFISMIGLQVVHMTTGILQIYADRFLTFIIVIAPIFVAQSLNVFFHRNEDPRFLKIKIMIIIFILIVTSVCSILTVFKSPYVLKANEQVTESELIGAKWFFNTKNSDIKIIDYSESQRRLGAATLGSSFASKRKDISYGDSSLIPDHFGYDHNSKLFGYFVNREIYMIRLKVDEIFYSKLITRGGRFNQSDFSLVKADPSIYKVYQNGNLEIDYVTYNPHSAL